MTTASADVPMKGLAVLLEVVGVDVFIGRTPVFIRVVEASDGALLDRSLRAAIASQTATVDGSVAPSARDRELAILRLVAEGQRPQSGRRHDAEHREVWAHQASLA